MEPEAEARIDIDKMLEASGWILQDYKDLNLGAGFGIAVREYPLSKDASDYALFIDRVPVGVVEAKAKGFTLSGVTNQSEGYLDGLEKKFPGHLSGGQKRLAALAGVLVLEPEVLILDEPSSNLDPRARRSLIQHLNGLENTRLVASHDLEMILDISARTILLSGGKIIADGDPAKILSEADLMAEHGLEVPHSLIPHSERHNHGVARKGHSRH